MRSLTDGFMPGDANPEITDDAYDWQMDITGADIQADEVDEGIYQNFSLAVGTYTCTLTNTRPSKDWYPLGAPTSLTDSAVVGAGRAAYLVGGETPGISDRVIRLTFR